LAEAPGARVEAVFTRGGSAFPDLLQRLEAGLPQAAINVIYGTPAADPIASMTLGAVGAGDWQRMAAGNGVLTGRPVSAIKLLIEEDEILVDGPHVSHSRLDPAADRPAASGKSGTFWHRTGDAGRLDEDGRLWL